MDEISILTVLQVVVALGLHNVWLVRARAAPAYRGGEATDLKQEFAAYGLSPGAFYTVGALKIGCALALLAGLWNPALVAPAAGVIVVLMLGALGMHLKVKDPPLKSLPAFLMLSMASLIVVFSTGALSA